MFFWKIWLYLDIATLNTTVSEPMMSWKLVCSSVPSLSFFHLSNTWRRRLIALSLLPGFWCVLAYVISRCAELLTFLQCHCHTSLGNSCFSSPEQSCSSSWRNGWVIHVVDSWGSKTRVEKAIGTEINCNVQICLHTVWQVMHAARPNHIYHAHSMFPFPPSVLFWGGDCPLNDSYHTTSVPSLHSTKCLFVSGTMLDTCRASLSVATHV